MASIVQQLTEKNLINPPTFVVSNTMYETISGSTAYGMSNSESDMDIIGFCIPYKQIIFPHLAGEILDFSTPAKRFHQYLQPEIFDKNALGGKGRKYDITNYSIVRFFKLCLDNNPNCLEVLYTPINCITHTTEIGTMVRDARKMFLHRGAFHKYRGYSFGQLNKMQIKKKNTGKILAFEDAHKIDHSVTFFNLKEELGRREKSGVELGFPLSNLSDSELKLYYKLYSEGIGESGRFENVKINGFDSKFAAHCIRLMDQAEQILLFGDIDLQKNSDYFKAIRRGEIKPEEIKRRFEEKDKFLEKVYEESKLPYGPDEEKIKSLLLNCLELHYGSLSDCITNPNASIVALKEISDIIKRNENLIN